jgi:hypothetical protein
MTARRIISGDVLKQRKGLLIVRDYELAMPSSTQVNLTVPTNHYGLIT